MKNEHERLAGAYGRGFNFECDNSISLRGIIGSSTLIGKSLAKRLASLSEVKLAGRREADIWWQDKFSDHRPNLQDMPEISDHSLYDRIDYWPRVDNREGFQRIRDHREKNS